ncbi:MAG: hypothetical protein OEX10_09645, partial [Candidatus Bathyarchaeota archaeon]|nr:hypothetical protein [Candidatus Bathyarchaeota archaeon]
KERGRKATRCNTPQLSIHGASWHGDKFTESQIKRATNQPVYQQTPFRIASDDIPRGTRKLRAETPPQKTKPYQPKSD